MTSRVLVLSGLFAVASLAAAQSNSVTLVPPHDSLLPPNFGEWHSAATAAPAAAEPAMSLVGANKAALEECGPQRSEVQTYTGPGGRTLHVEAIQFGDYTGAYSAYTLVRQLGLKDAKDLGSNDAIGDNAVLFTSGGTLAVAFPATAADLKALQPLAASLPQVHGSQAQPPLIPTFLPEKGLAPGSIRYALGAASYAAQGGVLPAASIGWDKSAEAITAQYKDKRGDETLTLLLYPTPQIAGAHLHQIEGMVPGLGAKFATAKVRREGELVMLANGTFDPDQAQKMIENIHMHQQLSIDKTDKPEFRNDIKQTYSVLYNITVLSGVLMAAAVLLGLFLGGGRALLRVARGKSAAVEPEFLSLSLANQNAAPRFEGEDKS